MWRLRTWIFEPSLVLSGDKIRWRQTVVAYSNDWLSASHAILAGICFPPIPWPMTQGVSVCLKNCRPLVNQTQRIDILRTDSVFWPFKEPWIFVEWYRTTMKVHILWHVRKWSLFRVRIARTGDDISICSQISPGEWFVVPAKISGRVGADSLVPPRSLWSFGLMQNWHGAM
jgi:hypothetical protein